MKRENNLIGQRFGRLVVISRAENYVSPKGKKSSRWHCLCDCGAEAITARNSLVKGATKSCGCFRKETTQQTGMENFKQNSYYFCDDYATGIASNTKNEFYFDTEDYDKIKNYCWYEDSNGYVVAYNKISKSSTSIRLHRMILNCEDNLVVDHIDRNKLNNRKNNLRKCMQSENTCNTSFYKNNTSGFKGVSYDKKVKKWRAYITKERKRIHLGWFLTVEEAYEERVKAEKQMFGEFASEDNRRN